VRRKNAPSALEREFTSHRFCFLRRLEFYSWELSDYEKTSLVVAAAGQNLNDNNRSFLRVGVSRLLLPAAVDFAKPRCLGRFRFARGIQPVARPELTFQHDTVTSPSSVNTFRFQFARVGCTSAFSQFPRGRAKSESIFPVLRILAANRIQRWTALSAGINLPTSWRKPGAATHSSFGGDFNLIQLRSAKAQIFEA